MRPVSMPERLSPWSTEGPHSRRKVQSRASTRYALCKRPPDPNASPDPSTVTRTMRAYLYRSHRAERHCYALGAGSRPSWHLGVVKTRARLLLPWRGMDGSEPHVLAQGLSLIQLGLIAGALGWFAEYLLNTGVSTRGMPFLAGLFGIYVSSHLSFLPASSGPVLGGHALLPAFAGAFVICSFLKLANLGMAGPRW